MAVKASTEVYDPGARTPIQRGRRSIWRQMWRHRLEYLLISPFFIIFSIFHGYPLVWAFWISFHQWQGIGAMRWFGLGNYIRLLRNPRIWAALSNTMIFLVIMLPLGIAAALLLANLLNNPKLKGRGIFRTLFFLPYITSAVITAIIFAMLFQDNFGWINSILETLNLPRVPWLSRPWPARISTMILLFWGGTGYSTLIMLGGLQSISQDLYDAASVDGANARQQFRYVTIPMMRGVILFLMITGTIGLLNLFAQPYLLFSNTRGQGPDNSVATLSIIQFNLAFSGSRYGEAAALGFIIGILVICVSLLQFKLLRGSADT